MHLKQLAIRHAGVIRWASVALIALGFLLTLRAFPTGRAVATLERWVDELGVLGPVVFGVVYILTSLLLLPAALLTFVAGAAFGFTLGVVVVSISATAAAGIAFLIARYLARDRIERLFRQTPRFAALDRAIAEGGARVVALLRLSPVVPYTFSNYAFGLTKVRFWPYVVATWLFMLPGTMVYVYVGHFGAEQITAEMDPAARRSTLEWVLLFGGLISTAAATVYLTQLARKHFKRFAEMEGIGDEPTRSGPSRHSWPWVTISLVVLAVLWLIAAGVVNAYPDAIGQLFDDLPGHRSTG